MDNLEEDTQETITTVVGATTSSSATAGAVPTSTLTDIAASSGQEQNFDDSVILLQPRVDVVDLTTSPTQQPSTSAGAGALLKPKIEEPSSSKDTSCAVAAATDNPSTSTSSSTTVVSGLTGASLGGAVGGSTSTNTAAATTTNLLECPICLQTCIHPARLPCGHIFCFLCVKGVAYKNRRCAMCRREIPPEFLDHPQLVNGIEDICTTKATDDGYQWFYEGRNGWWQYDDRTSQDLEEAFKKGERSCTILVAGYVYIVDFDAMIQQRQNEPARCRRVKRDLATIPKKGVAGLRIEGNTVTTDSNFAQQVYFQNRYHNDDLDIHDTALIGGAHAMDASNPQGPLRLSYGLGGYVIELGNPSEFVSTAAATDAALRIASDIIGSTLAHADELTRSNTSVTNNSTSNTTSSYEQQPLSSISADTSYNPATGELILNDLALISQPQQQQQQLQNQQQFSLMSTPTNVGVASNNISTLAAMVHQQQQPVSTPSSSTSSNLPRERGSRELLGAAEDLLGATQRVIATADQPTIDLFEQTLNDFHALTLRNIVDSSDDDDGLHHHQHQHHHHQHQPPQQSHNHQQTPPTPPAHGHSHNQPAPSNGQRSTNQQHNNLP